MWPSGGGSGDVEVGYDKNVNVCLLCKSNEELKSGLGCFQLWFTNEFRLHSDEEFSCLCFH